MSEIQRTYVFTCPECKNNTFEEVLMSVIQSTSFQEVIVELTKEEGVEDSIELCEPVFMNASAEGGELERYQCVECGWIIPEASSPDDLARWLQTHGTVKEEHAQT